MQEYNYSFNSTVLTVLNDGVLKLQLGDMKDTEISHK